MCRVLSPFQASDLSVRRTTTPRARPAPQDLKFGATFTDHWFNVAWNEKTGWGAPKIEPYGKISLDPSALVFHYALECFEGLKAYVDAQGRLRMFRPEENMKRMATSASRLAFPELPQEAFLKCVQELVKVDRDWVPALKGYSLYLRPTLIATTVPFFSCLLLTSLSPSSVWPPPRMPSFMPLPLQ